MLSAVLPLLVLVAMGSMVGRIPAAVIDGWVSPADGGYAELFRLQARAYT